MVRIVFSENAKQTYDLLQSKSDFSKQEKILMRSLHSKLSLLQNNPHLGNPIAKRLIPKTYIQEYSLTNLFRVELPLYWRMLYTLRSDSDVEIIAFILDISDHKNYNELFGYKNKK